MRTLFAARRGIGGDMRRHSIKFDIEIVKELGARADACRLAESRLSQQSRQLNGRNAYDRQEETGPPVVY
jgi:hypothetical protein